jgi:D-glycero-D-manno-heptose 1,7-bisphosphate phosphatase
MASRTPTLRPAVFLDRDDTLIVNRAITAPTAHPGSLYDPALVRLMPGAAEACRVLKGAGFALVVVTNQGAVARGECTIAQVEATNARVRDVVREEAGVELDGIYYCPYHPKGTAAPWSMEHPSRKPQPGMLLAAARELGLDLAASWMIGDAQRDIEAALAAGIPPAQTIILGEELSARAVHRVATLERAAGVVLGR